MSQRLFALSVLATSAVYIGCSADTATQEPRPIPPPQTAPAIATEVVSLPENGADLAIRRELDSAIAQDANLSRRRIIFRVTNGDVRVTGTVHTEEERGKINGLAMNIGGVKSVANALHVED